MERLQGIPVSPGIAIGEALVFDNEGFRIPRRFLPREVVEEELHRLDSAIAAATAELVRKRDRVAQQLGDQYAAIFTAHAHMLNDPRLRGELEEMIRQRHYSPEYSVSRALRRLAKIFESLEGPVMRERVSDIYDIEKRLLKHLLGERREELANLTSEVLVLAHDLTPGETANLDPHFVLGMVTEIGGSGSHTAIVAEGLGIPAVVGTGPFLNDVSGGETVIIDGDHGVVILHPDEETLARYRHEFEEHRTHAVELESLRELPAETTDGTVIELLGNIEFPEELPLCTDRGARGIGLYRTEFLYLRDGVEPAEEDHYDAYRQVAEAMPSQPVIIRTLDLGADKVSSIPVSEDERNPFLGLRSIRLSLKNLDLFTVQLRAILRASLLGDVRIMFPLVSTLLELRQAKMVLREVMEDLEEEGLTFNRDLKIGMMVEVPAAIMMLDRFVDEVDFFSIGTNDLVQYVMAVDRGNKDVASLYTSSEPSVLRLLDRAIRIANEHGIPISMCGQMCGNPLYTMLLIGLGLRSMSITPAGIPEVKQVCRSVSVEHCQEVAKKTLELDTARDVKTFLKEELLQVLPGLPI